MREDGRLVGGEGWQEKVHNREEWKELLRMARNCHILHTLMEGMNIWAVYGDIVLLIHFTRNVLKIAPKRKMWIAQFK